MEEKRSIYTKINALKAVIAVAVDVVKKDSPDGLCYPSTEYWTLDGVYIGGTGKPKEQEKERG